MWLQTLLLATPATQGAALPLRAAAETGEGTFAEDFPALPQLSPLGEASS